MHCDRCIDFWFVQDSSFTFTLPSTYSGACYSYERVLYGTVRCAVLLSVSHFPCVCVSMCVRDPLPTLCECQNSLVIDKEENLKKECTPKSQILWWKMEGNWCGKCPRRRYCTFGTVTNCIVCRCDTQSHIAKECPRRICPKETLFSILFSKVVVGVVQITFRAKTTTAWVILKGDLLSGGT